MVEAVMSYAVIHTNMGDITFTLLPHAVEAIENFRDLVDLNLYNGTRFHYVVKGFIIQGGDVVGPENDDVADYFDDEYDPNVLFDRPFLVGTAGRGQLSHPSQFFITLRPAPHLNFHHTIFGEVADPIAQHVVRVINSVPTAHMEPVDPIIIESVSVDA